MDLHKAYSNLLDNTEWDYFVTFTSAYKLTSIEASSLMNRFKAAIKSRDVQIFWVAERYKNKAGVHIHALIKVPNESNYIKKKGNSFYVELWQKLSKKGSNYTTNRADVLRYNTSKSATYYITKDILKDYTEYGFLY